MAQRAAPDARIVYADYDPVVITRARSLLTSTPEGATDYIQADGPGVVSLSQWFGASEDRGLQAYCGVGREP